MLVRTELHYVTRNCLH